MRFFTDDKCQRGTSHAEYAEYWRDNLDRMPAVALRVSAGMLPADMFAETNHTVELHDARIISTGVSDGQLSIILCANKNGESQTIEMLYACSGFEIPEIPPALLEDMPHCDLMCHEFHSEHNYYVHQILFANGIELTIQFQDLGVNLTPVAT